MTFLKADLKIAGNIVLLWYNGSQIVSQMKEVDGRVFKRVCPLGGERGSGGGQQGGDLGGDVCTGRTVLMGRWGEVSIF